MSFLKNVFASCVISCVAVPAWAASDIVWTSTVESGTASYDTAFVSPTGSVLFKEASLTVADYLVVEGGSLSIEKGNFTQQNANDLQSLTIRAGGNFSLTSGAGTIAGKADLIDATVTVKADKDTTASFNVGKAFTSQSSSITFNTKVSASAESITLADSSLNVIGSTFTTTGAFIATGSTVSLSGAKIEDTTIPSLTTAGKDSSITGGSFSADQSSFSAGTNNLTFTDTSFSASTGSTVTANDISFMNTNLSINSSVVMGSGNIVIDGGTISSNSGELSASGTIDLKNGTHSFTGQSAMISATTVYIRPDVTLNLSYGARAEGILNVDGSLSMKEATTQTLLMNGGTDSNGKIDMKWNNAINGDFTLTNSAMTMTKDDTHNSILTINGGDMSVSNSSVSIDSGVIDNSAGAVNFDSNSSLSLRIGGTSSDQYGHIIANSINIATSGTSLSIILDPGAITTSNGQANFTLFDAATLTGNFATLEQNNLYSIVSLGNGEYSITDKNSAGSIITNEDNVLQNAADAWMGAQFPANTQAAAIASELSYLSQTPGQEQNFTDAMSALILDKSPLVTTLSNSLMRQLSNVIDDRLAKVPGRGAYGSIKQPAHESGLWVQGLADKMDYKGDSPFNASNVGAAIGMDVGSNLFRVGLGYAYTKTDADAVGRSTDVDSHVGIIYLTTQSDGLYFDAMGMYGMSSYSENKQVSSFAVSADYDARFWGVQGLIGFNSSPVMIGRDNMGSFMPELGIRYSSVTRQSYKDSAGQVANDADASTLTGTVGLKWTVNYLVGKNVIYPNLKLAATYDFIQDDMESTVRLANGLGYIVTGENLDKLGVEVGAEIGIVRAGAFDMSVSYLGSFRKDYTDHAGLFNFRYYF